MYSIQIVNFCQPRRLHFSLSLFGLVLYTPLRLSFSVNVKPDPELTPHRRGPCRLFPGGHSLRLRRLPERRNRRPLLLGQPHLGTPAVSLPIFDGGRNRAGLRSAEAFWNEAAADYRLNVLAAIGEVEDGLSGLRHLGEQADFLERAENSAAEAAELSRIRYRAGMVSYLEVVDAERTMLESQRQAARVLGQRLETSVFLIRALGGGWDEGEEGKVASNSQSVDGVDEERFAERTR